MKQVYFWNGKEVVYEFECEGCDDLNALYCLDSSFGAPSLRYGKFIKGQWKSVPLEEFPKEFRMQLLLLGVG